MERKTKEEVRGVIHKFVDGFASRLPTLARSARATMESRGQLKPFHYAVLPQEFATIPNFERSYSTSLGNCFQDCAQIIASEKFTEAKLRNPVEGQLAAAALTTIEHLMSQIEAEGMKGRYPEFVAEIVNVQPRGLTSHRIPQVDLYLRDHRGYEYYFEMRSPKPNQSQCLSATRKAFEIHAIKRKGFPEVQTYCSMAYNPYGTKEAYKHSFGVRLLDIYHQVFAGEEFWTFIGDGTTYMELLGIFQEIGRLRQTELSKALQAIMPQP